MPVVHKQLLTVIQGELAQAQQDDLLRAILVISVQEQLKRIDALQNYIDHIGQRELGKVCINHLPMCSARRGAEKI